MPRVNVKLEAPLTSSIYKDRFVKQLLASGGAIECQMKNLPWVTVRVQKEEDIDALPGVELAEIDGGCQNCAYTLDDVRAITGVSTAQQYTNGSGAIVAAIDTGISPHPDLANLKLVRSESFVPSEDSSDLNGHGEASVGIVHAMAPGAGISMLKALNYQGDGRWSWVANALDRAIELKPNITLMALGGEDYSAMIDSALAILSKYSIIVVAAGNTGKGKLDFPASSPYVIAVAAIDNSGRPASFSSWAKWPEGPDIAAPGVGIETLTPISGYRRMSGTSMAADVVAGIMALAISRRRDITDTSSARAVIHKEAIRLNAPRERVGYGLLNAEALIS